MGDIFNHHSSVFYMSEPLQTNQRVEGKSDQIKYELWQYGQAVFDRYI